MERFLLEVPRPELPDPVFFGSDREGFYGRLRLWKILKTSEGT